MVHMIPKVVLVLLVVERLVPEECVRNLNIVKDMIFKRAIALQLIALLFGSN